MAAERKPAKPCRNPPISTAGPTSHEVRNNEEMKKYLDKNCNISEDENGCRKRQSVIDKINKLLRDWASEIGASKNIASQYLVNGGGTHVLIFGSTRLDVHNSESDIDTLCVAPSFVTREDFFTSFVKKLEERHDVESLTAIAEAYTPVVKFTIDNQSVDMVFASVAPDYENDSPAISPHFDISDVKCLKGLDDQSVRSINGARVAEKIIESVPNMATFCSALRIIKFWARQRGLYSNVLGFLGGVNYAILVAFICQLYTNACPFTTVQKFFNVLTLWAWPNPILIQTFEDLKLKDSSGRPLPVWNPRANYKDSLHIMPIITPAYPSMNSAYNVSTPQYRCIQEEIQRANLMFQKHSLSSGAVFNWKTLLEPCTKEFFSRYPRYIQVNISATTVSDHRNWFGWVESRLRMLIVSLEQPPMIYSHPMANCFHREPKSLSTSSSSAALDPSAFPPLSAVTSTTAAATTATDVLDASLLSPKPRRESDIDLYSLNLASQTKPKQPSSSSVSASSSAVSLQESSATGMTTPERPGSRNSATTNDSYSAALSGNQQQHKSPRLQSDSGSTLLHPLVVPVCRGSSDDTTTSAATAQATTTAAATGNHSDVWNSTFFIGLTFQQGATQADADVTPAVMDFTYRANAWLLKKPTMNMEITCVTRDTVPDFVFKTKAEPSNPKNCTPRVKRSNREGFNFDDILVRDNTDSIRRTSNSNNNSSSRNRDNSAAESYLHSRLIPENTAATTSSSNTTPSVVSGGNHDNHNTIHSNAECNNTHSSDGQNHINHNNNITTSHNTASNSNFIDNNSYHPLAVEDPRLLLQQQQQQQQQQQKQNIVAQQQNWILNGHSGSEDLSPKRRAASLSSAPVPAPRFVGSGSFDGVVGMNTFYNSVSPRHHYYVSQNMNGGGGVDVGVGGGFGGVNPGQQILPVDENSNESFSSAQSGHSGRGGVHSIHKVLFANDNDGTTSFHQSPTAAYTHPQSHSQQQSPVLGASPFDSSSSAAPAAAQMGAGPVFTAPPPGLPSPPGLTPYFASVNHGNTGTGSSSHAKASARDDVGDLSPTFTHPFPVQYLQQQQYQYQTQNQIQNQHNPRRQPQPHQQQRSFHQAQGQQQSHFHSAPSIHQQQQQQHSPPGLRPQQQRAPHMKQQQQQQQGQQNASQQQPPWPLMTTMNNLQPPLPLTLPLQQQQHYNLINNLSYKPHIGFESSADAAVAEGAVTSAVNLRTPTAHQQNLGQQFVGWNGNVQYVSPSQFVVPPGSGDHRHNGQHPSQQQQQQHSAQQNHHQQPYSHHNQQQQQQHQSMPMSVAGYPPYFAVDAAYLQQNPQFMQNAQGYSQSTQTQQHHQQPQHHQQHKQHKLSPRALAEQPPNSHTLSSSNSSDNMSTTPRTDSEVASNDATVSSSFAPVAANSARSEHQPQPPLQLQLPPSTESLSCPQGNPFNISTYNSPPKRVRKDIDMRNADGTGVGAGNGGANGGDCSSSIL